MRPLCRTIRALAVWVGVLSIGFIPAAALGQAITSASITGKVTDPSGGVVPEAKVTVISPALQVPEVSTATDANGEYKFLDLPAPGVYRITITREGFETYVQEGVNLGVGFTAKIDASLKVGSVSQSVEVTGQNPVVDTVSTAGTATLQEQEIHDSPKGVGLQELLPMSPGVSLQGKPDVGDSNLAARSAIITYGVVLEPTLDVEGINTTTAKDADSAVYLDTFALAEVEFKTSGNNADVAFPGVDQEVVMKSGGNTFHGDVRGDYENPSFQGNNINATLAAPPNNLKVANQLKDSGYYDYSADFGGRIITNKLWFYGGLSNQRVTQGQVNFVGAPDAGGCWTCADSKPANVISALSDYNYKISYQIKPSTKVIFSDLYGNKFLSSNGATPLVPLPSTQYEHQPDSSWHGEVQSAPTPRLLVDALFGHGGYHVNYLAQPASNIGQFGYTKGSEFAGSPSEEELSTKQYSGPYPFIQDRPQNRYQAKGTVSFLPTNPHFGAMHQLKFGTDLDWELAGTRSQQNQASGNYLLQFQNGKPNRIVVYNYPFPNSINHLYSQAGFVTDTMRVKRLTVNLGIRGERYHSFYPTQTKVAGQFSNIFPAQTYKGQDILTWVDVVPRVGAAWDVKGNGKTVIKGSFGLFGDTMGDLFANTFNPNAQQSNTYNWSGPCAPTDPVAPVQYACDVTPGFLSTLPSLTPVAATGSASQLLNAALKQDKTHEYTVAVERELMPNVALNATYVYHGVFNLYDSATNISGVVAPTATFVSNGINVGHPYSSYTVPVVFIDSFHGVNTPVTVYTYPKNSGSNANQVLNTPSGRPDTYNSIAVGVTKRYSRRWNGFASFWTTKDHRWIQGLAGIAGSPNDDRFPVDDTWNWEARGDVTYNLPKGFQVFSFFRAQSGTPGQRLSVFNSSALNQGSTQIRMGPFGQYRGPVVSTLNVKVAKTFTIHDRFHIEGNFQVFNVLNSSGAVTTNYQTGPTTFGVISSLISPRVARIGGVFSF
ncbi:MAG TPA: carboxypeptidase-like regulatory domain-containing protein [Acidobacteriaceae bacterium]